MNKLIAFLAFALWSQMVFGQDQEEKLSFYYASNHYELNEAQQSKLKHWLKSIRLEKVLKFHVYGYTDDIANDAYNFGLSQRRANTVKLFLMKNDIPEQQIQTHFLGETEPMVPNEDNESRQKNRRTVVIAQMSQSIALDILEKEKVLVEDHCEGDTTIRLPQGTLVTLDKCDYLRKSEQDCIKLREFTNSASLQRSNLTTTDRKGRPLVSGGMFEVELCNETPMTFYVPVYSDCVTPSKMVLWNGTEEGSWSRNAKNAPNVSIVKINRKKYYKVQIRRSGKYNLDYPPRKLIKVKVKTPKALPLVVAKIAADCPLGLLVETPENKKRNKVIFTLPPCPNQSPVLYAEALNAQGDTLVMDFTVANILDKRIMFGKCKKKKVLKRIMGFGVKEKFVYRKYLLKEDDFVEKFAQNSH